jgi:hypothetical protein
LVQGWKGLGQAVIDVRFGACQLEGVGAEELAGRQAAGMSAAAERSLPRLLKCVPLPVCTVCTL